GGTITPVVERCATTSAAGSACAAPPDSSAAAPATPAAFSTSRRVCPSIAHILPHPGGAEPTRAGPIRAARLPGSDRRYLEAPLRTPVEASTPVLQDSLTPSNKRSKILPSGSGVHSSADRLEPARYSGCRSSLAHECPYHCGLNDTERS